MKFMIIQYSKENERLLYSFLEYCTDLMEKGEPAPWVVKQNVNKERNGYYYVTERLVDFDTRELMFNFNANPDKAQEIINLVGACMVAFDCAYEDEIQIYGNFAGFEEDIFVVNEGEKYSKVIIPDEKGKYPWDNDCMEVYRKQLI